MDWNRIISGVDGAWQYCRDAIGLVFQVPAQAFVGLFLLVVLSFLGILIVRFLASVFFPSGGIKIREGSLAKSSSTTKDPTVSLHGDHVEFLKSGNPVKLIIRTNTGNRTVLRAKLNKRWTGWESSRVELDSESYWKVCQNDQNDENCEFKEIQLFKDNGLWNHPNLEIRYSVRLTVIFFVISVFVSALIEWIIV